MLHTATMAGSVEAPEYAELERRRAARQRANRLTACTTAQRQEFHWALACDLSEGGAGLVTNRDFDPGVNLMLHLLDGRGRLLVVPAQVVHCRLDPSGSWLVGCEFAERIDSAALAALA